MSDFYDIGVGIDLVDINRFKERPYSTNQSFYKKIFSDDEIAFKIIVATFSSVVFVLVRLNSFFGNFGHFL